MDIVMFYKTILTQNISMIDVNKTVSVAATMLLNEIKLNSKRRDIDTMYIVAINELGKIYSHMLSNFYSREEIDSISNVISVIAKANKGIKLFSKPGNYPLEGYILTTDDNYYISTDDSYTIKID